MKNFLLIAVVLLSGLSLFAQETTITKDDFDKVMFGNFQALRNQPHRTIEVSEHQTLGNVLKTKMIRERSMGNYRMIYESDSATSYIKSETISINGKRFNKTLNNPWVEETIEAKPPAPNKFETVSTEATYKSLGENVLNDKKVKAYKTTEVRNLINKENGDESVWNTTTTFWFDETGMLVKSEQISETINKPKQKEGETMVRKETKSITKRITVTEIDPNIKIEAPQIG